MTLFLADLLPLLQCPCCGGGEDLLVGDEGLVCGECGRRFAVLDGVPVLLCEERDVEVVPVDHESNPVDEGVLDWLDSLDGWSLNLGAGASLRRPARCVELEYARFRNTSVVEYARFRNTSVVGDAHRLPFKDAIFDAVVSYNTFEHLADPPVAASELLRVLKPGGKLRVQSAFLQPLHEEPAHYYNATEYGLRRWFSGFDIDTCFVPGNMSPVYALGWIAAMLLHYTRSDAGSRETPIVANSSLGEWADFWDRRFLPAEPGSPVQVVSALSDVAQRKLAFGYELHGTAPDRSVKSLPLTAPPTSSVSLADLLPLLQCPCCGGGEDLLVGDEGLVCGECGRRFAVLNGVPVLLCEERDVEVVPVDHESNPVDEGVLDWLDSLDGWSLNLGAGASLRRPNKCVELEYSLFRNTSVVGDAHRLPFKDAIFDAVVSYNTFEHLADPPVAASELLRVLKPGGKLRVQSGFLQPLHEEPAHYYNTTEYGLRRWFSGFDIDTCFVPPEFGPAHMLGWLSNHLIYHLVASYGPEMGPMARSLRLSQFARFHGPPAEHHGFLKAIFDLMPAATVSHFAAGFELRATRPGGTQMEAADTRTETSGR